MPDNPLHHVHISSNGESAEAMVAELRRILDDPPQFSDYRREDGTVDEELIAWTRAVLPWLGRSVHTRSHGHILAIVRIHAEAAPELRFGPYRLNKVRRAIRGVYEAIREATEQG